METSFMAQGVSTTGNSQDTDNSDKKHKLQCAQVKYSPARVDLSALQTTRRKLHQHNFTANRKKLPLQPRSRTQVTLYSLQKRCDHDEPFPNATTT